jgi:hypothetical protein
VVAQAHSSPVVGKRNRFSCGTGSAPTAAADRRRIRTDSDQIV